jgi:SAM-dependent methyltransferase
MLCGGPGETLHEGLRDRRYDAPGEWTMVSCRKCMLAWLDPVPLEEDLGRAYSGYYTHTIEEPSPTLARRLNSALTNAHSRRYGYRSGSPVWSSLLALVAWAHPGGEAELGRDVMYLPAPTPGALLLEVGCGNGEFLARMRDRGWKTLGVDVDPEAVEAAKSRSLDVKRGELTRLELPSDHADAVVLSHVIEHIHDPIGLLVECGRVLKPGGLVVVTTPNAAARGHRRFGSSWWPLDPPRHLVLFNTSAMRTAAELAGLEIVRLSTTSRGARTVWSESARIAASGRVDVDKVPGVCSHLMGLPFQLRERLMTRLGRDEGEELLLVATRT